MMIRRRTLRLALHQKSTTVTFDGAPGLGGVPLTAASLVLRDDAVKVPMAGGELAAPSREGWLRRMFKPLARSRNLLLLALLGVAGCHTSGHFGADPVVSAQVHLAGKVMGGQQPVVGAAVNLYAAGSGGDQTGATLLTNGAPVLTQADGSFDLTGTYHCPSQTAQVFLLATGGNPGLGSGQVNPQIAAMIAVGSCSILQPQNTQQTVPFLSVNEVTTVAAVYALAPFMASSTNIGFTSTGASDEAILDDDFTVATALADYTTGGSPGPLAPQGFAVDPKAVNAMANILATCINSSGGTARGTACGDFFYYATPPNGGTAPTNTVDALLDIVNNPTNNVGYLYGLPTGTPPFQPTLKNAPTDWNIIPQATLTLAANAYPVAINGSTTGTLTLGRPLQNTTASVPLTSSATNFVTVNSPVALTAGQSAYSFTYNGIANGEATVSEMLGGYSTSMATLIATNQIISISNPGSVAVGSTVDLPLSLGQNAPNGGVTITLASGSQSDTGSVTFSSTTVMIPAGARVPAANPQVSGKTAGTVTLSATAPGFSQSIVQTNVISVTASLPSTLSTAIGATSEILTLSAPAPNGGLIFTLSSSSTGTFTVPQTATVQAGATTATIAIQAIADGTATLTATNPMASAASSSITVDAGTRVYNVPNVGNSLETTGQFYSNQAPRSATTATLTSSNPAVLTLSTAQSTAGTASIQYPNYSGSTTVFYVQGMSTGTAMITLTAPNFDTSSVMATVGASGVLITPSSFSISTLSTPYNLTLSTYSLDANYKYLSEQPLRPGVDPTVHLTSGTPATGTVPASAAFADNTSEVTFGFSPKAAGNSVVSIDTPTGFTTPASYQSSTATVTAPAIDTYAQNLAYNGQTAGTGSLDVSPNKPVSVTITSDNPALLIAPDVNTVGTSSLTLTNISNTSAFNYVIQGTATGTANLTFSAPGYTNAVSAVTIYPSGFLPIALTQTFTTLDGPYMGNGVFLYLLDHSNNAAYAFNLRAGVSAVIPLSSADPTIIGVSSTVQMTAGNHSAYSTETPAGNPGNTRITVSQPAGYTTPTNQAYSTVTVTAPVIDLSGGNVGFNTYTRYYVSLDKTPKNATTITITSNNANVLLTATETSVGTSSITFTNVTSTSNMQFWVQGVTQGSSMLTISAPSYQTIVQPVSIYPTGFALAPVTFNTTTFSQPSQIGVYASPLDPTSFNVAANQPLRPGVNATINLTSSAPGVATISGSVMITSGNYLAYANFTPVASGMATITIPTQPAGGYSAPNNYNQSVGTVTAPAIDVSSNNFTAVNLQNYYSFHLDQAPPAAESVTITSNSAAVLLSTSPTVLGTNSITFNNVTDTSSLTYYVQGVSNGGATLTFSAAGYASATATATIYNSGFALEQYGYSPSNTPTSITLSNGNGIGLYLSSIALDANGNYYNQLPLGPQAGTVNVQVTNSSPSVGTYPTSIMVPVNSGSIYNAFQSTATGMTTLTLVTPNGFTTPTAGQAVMITVQ